MKSTGMELTLDGFNKVKELDTNGDGKIEEGEVKLGLVSKGNDYKADANHYCIGCIIWNCMATLSCVTNPGSGRIIKFKYFVNILYFL